MALSNFRVIVVGGGPVGLTAAHALHKAGIDFLVLERSSQIVNSAGSNLVLSPLGLRAMSQLGILKNINAVSSPLGRIDRMSHTGRDIGSSLIFEQMKTSMGMSPRVISRVDLNLALYTSLPIEAQRKVLSSKKLSDIIPTSDGVIAVCADGSRYESSIVVGADGAHSVVRDVMRRLSIARGSTKVNTDTPFLATYRCLWLRFPRPSALPVGMTCETHGRDLATQFFVGEKTGVIGVYERMEKPTKERTRYIEEDQAALVERWGHLPVIPKGELTLRDIYESRLDAGMVSLEEGVLEHWSADSRIVLAGDAAHKFTPSLGSGCNNGIIDVMTLVNELHLAQQSGAQANLQSQQIQSAFDAYQTKRHAIVTGECSRSGQVTATASWQSGIQKAIDQHLLSRHVLQKALISLGGVAFRRELAPEFVTSAQTPQILVAA